MPFTPQIKSTLGTAIEGVAVLGPGWRRLSGLFLISMLATLFEGFGIGIMLPIAELMQRGGEISAAMREQGYWYYLLKISDQFGVSLNLSTLLLTCLSLFMIRNALMYARTVALTSSLQKTIRDIRVHGFRLFLRAHSDYQDRLSAGRLASDLTTQAGTSAGSIHSFVTLAHVSFMGLYYLFFLLILSWTLTLFVLVIVVAAAVIVRPISQRSQKVGDNLVRANQAASAFLVERLSAARLIRLAQIEQAEITDMYRRSDLQAVGELTLARNSARTSVIMETLIVICGLSLLYFGGTVLQLELATIGLTVAILLRQLPVAREFIVARQAIISNMPATAHIVALFRDMAQATEPEDGKLSRIKMTRGIEMKDIVFEYGRDLEPALRGISVTFPAGKLTALVGPSGGGKSTLIDLLPRLRNPKSGEILIDGVPTHEFSRSALRTFIAYAPQAPQIFNCSVAQHIRYGKPGATDDEIREAAHLAGADSFIESWPDQYDTFLGERGVALSGGQKQRIDLARTLVSGARVLIFDEPTSNVDADTEHYFESTLKLLRKQTQCTIIVVGHRLSTVRNADQIAVIRDGTVAETGTHAELLDQNGWYARAFRLQAQGLALTN